MKLLATLFCKKGDKCGGIATNTSMGFYTLLIEET